MKSYNITLSESELLDVVTALEAAPHRVLRRGPDGSALLSRQIADQAAEQFHDARLLHVHDARQQLSLPYGPPSEWSYV